MTSEKRNVHQESISSQNNSSLPMKKRRLRRNKVTEDIHLDIALFQGRNKNECQDPHEFVGPPRDNNHSIFQSEIEKERKMLKIYENLCREKTDLLVSLSLNENSLLRLQNPEEISSNLMFVEESQISSMRLDQHDSTNNKNHANSAFDMMWQQRYEELVAFWEKNGHCCVPQRYRPNQTLGKWVHKQRQEFKKIREGLSSPLTPYRIEALKKIGFQVDTKNRAEALWQQRFKELLQFRELHGHCNVPQKYSPNKSLGKWVHRQRHEFKKMRNGQASFLTAERVEALDGIGFQRSPRQSKKNWSPQSIVRALQNQQEFPDFQKTVRDRSLLSHPVNINVPEYVDNELKRHMVLRTSRSNLLAVSNSYLAKINAFKRSFDESSYRIVARTA